MMVTVIGRGHSGTRAMSHTLTASGVFMGAPLNQPGDLIPPEDMYAACRIMGPNVKQIARAEWDFSPVFNMPIPAEFTRLIESYLISVRESKAEHKGWKIPETTLVFPWIARLYPKNKYIYWIRDPRDSILGEHCTDQMERFGMPHEPVPDVLMQRAVSWKYQYDLVQATPKPEHWIEVRLEDFVLKQDETLDRLGKFLGIKMAKIPVKPEAVGRWKQSKEKLDFDFLKQPMREYRYE